MNFAGEQWYPLQVKDADIIEVEQSGELDPNHRYVVMFRAWNGMEWEVFGKTAKTTESVIGLVKLILKNMDAYQISITDRKEGDVKMVV